MVSFVCEEIVDVAFDSSLFEFSPHIILLRLHLIYDHGCELIFITIWVVFKVVLKDVQAKLNVIYEAFKLEEKLKHLMELRVGTIQLVNTVDREKLSQILHHSSTNISEHVAFYFCEEFHNGSNFKLFILFKFFLKIIYDRFLFIFLSHNFQSFKGLTSSYVLFLGFLQLFGYFNNNLIYVVISFCCARD